MSESYFPFYETETVILITFLANGGARIGMTNSPELSQGLPGPIEKVCDRDKPTKT